MTIIQPNKNKYRFTSPFFWLALALIILAIGNISFYNQNVNLRHSIKNNTEELQDQRVMNADYKNQFYKILDPDKVELLAKKKGLVPEKNPKYFEA